MNAEFVPVLPESAPFTPEQRAYLNGFFAGLYSRAPVEDGVASAVPSRPLRPLTILFGSQTGNAETLAKRVAKEAGKNGYAPTIFDMAQYPLDNLKAEQQLLVITSTYGDGDPPDNAKTLWHHISNGHSPSLDGVKYSVLALGDSNYEKFCACGKNFDRRLEELGAKRMFDRVDCDVDYEEPFQKWLAGVMAASGGQTSRLPVSVTTDHNRADETSAPLYSRKNPFPARLLTNRKLNNPGSGKDTRHFEISLERSGLTYEAGDAIGVWPTNPPERVEQFLRAIECNGDADAMRAALLKEYELARVAVPQQKVPAAEFLVTLKKLQPRLYSIASSPKAYTGQVHLCVAIVRGDFPGVCSTYLADRVSDDTPVPVFVQSNKNFRPPAQGDTPMIMVGPGTGIAPFRAFLEERRAVGAKGRNWLFFGDQRAATDFLYREELEAMLADGTLTRLDTAFSRDQAQKIYVQQRMLENAAELFAWLEAGAHFYVCGDAKRMAQDVDEALREVVRRAGRDADDYVQRLQAEKRYQRDVY